MRVSGNIRIHPAPGVDCQQAEGYDPEDGFVYYSSSEFELEPQGAFNVIYVWLADTTPPAQWITPHVQFASRRDEAGDWVPFFAEGRLLLPTTAEQSMEMARA